MSEQEKLLPCGMFERGQVWLNPDDEIMMVVSTRPADGCHRIEYVTEEGELGYFYTDNIGIIDNITLLNTRPQPAIEGDVVEWVKRAVFNDVGGSYDEAKTRAEKYGVTPPEIENADRIAKSAIAAMQPAIDKAVAEERARCVRVIRGLAGGYTNSGIATVLRGTAEAIEQGGGDA